jgi:hypothetical protein
LFDEVSCGVSGSFKIDLFDEVSCGISGSFEINTFYEISGGIKDLSSPFTCIISKLIS